MFCHEHSRFTGQQGKVETISLTPLHHFHPLHRHLDISRAITAESSPLHIDSSCARTGNLWSGFMRSHHYIVFKCWTRRVFSLKEGTFKFSQTVAYFNKRTLK